MADLITDLRRSLAEAVAERLASRPVGWVASEEMDVTRGILADALEEKGYPIEATATRCPWQVKLAKNYQHWRVRPPEINPALVRLFVPVKPRIEDRRGWLRRSRRLHLNAAPLLHFPAMTLRLKGFSEDEATRAYWLRFTWVEKRGTAGAGVRPDTDVMPLGYLALFSTTPPKPEPAMPLFDSLGDAP